MLCMRQTHQDNRLSANHHEYSVNVTISSLNTANAITWRYCCCCCSCCQCWWISIYKWHPFCSWLGCLDNFVWTLDQCCKLTKIPNFHITVKTFGNVLTSLYLCCVNIVVMSFPNTDDLSDNIVWALYQRWCTILYLVVVSSEWQLHKYLNFRHICNISDHHYIWTFTSTNVFV